HPRQDRGARGVGGAAERPGQRQRRHRGRGDRPGAGGSGGGAFQKRQQHPAREPGVAGRVRPAHRAGGQGGTVRRRGRTPTLVGAAAARRGSSLCPMDDDTPAAPWPWALRRWPWTLRRRTGAALVLALTGPLIAATVWARHHGGAEEGTLWPDAAA